MTESKLDMLASEFAGEKDNQTFLEFMMELEKSVVLVPASPSEEMASKIKEAAAKGINVPVPQGENPNICLLSKSDGSKVFPIFTSKEQVPKEKRPPALLSIPFIGVIGIVSGNMSQVKEIVVNPFTQGIVLNELLISNIDKRKKAEAAGADGNQMVQVTEKQFHVIAHAKLALEMLPGLLWANPQKLIDDLRSKKEQLIIDIYKSIYPKEIRCPYSEDDCAVMMLQIEDDLLITRIDLPENNKQVGSPLRIYITQKDSDYAYFIVEKGDGKSPGHIASVDTDRKKKIVCDAPDNGVEIETVMSLINPLENA